MLVLRGGTIYTLDPARPIADALLVGGGKVLATGTADELSGGAGRVQRVDLDGLTVVPGFVDSHTHFLGFAGRLVGLDLDGCRSLAETLARVAAKARMTPEGEWIRGQGWNKNAWSEPVFPDKRDLDSATAGRPAVLSSKDGHSAWLNARALQALGITGNISVPAGSEMRVDASGEPTGIFHEAGWLWQRFDGLVKRRDPTELIRRAIRVAWQLGLVGIHDCEGLDVWEAFAGLDRDGELGLRVNMLLPFDALDVLKAARLPYRWGSEYLKLGQLKAFADGALGSQTAYISREYPGRPGYRGIPTKTEDELREMAQRAARAGFPLAVHAIGDVANHQTLNALGAAPGLRHRIEHCQCVNPQDLPRFASQGIVASVQPSHAPSDRDVADSQWSDIAGWAYPFSSLRAAGARLAFGSDVPVESPDPLKGIYAAVARRRESEPARPPWHPEESLRVEQAVEAYTIGAAYAVEQENQRGRLRPGMFADLVVLNEDLLNVPAEAINRTRVVGTMVGGEFTFRAF